MDEWIVDVKKGIEKMDKHDHPEAIINYLRVKRCIFKVPEKLMDDKNIEDYKPQRVSFGPFHEPWYIILSTHIQNQGDPIVGPMERIKNYAFLRFLKKSEKEIKLYTDALYGEVDNLTFAYQDIYNDGIIGNKNDFIQTLMRDGCFILQLLHVGEEHCESEFQTNNPLFGYNMILNQLPLIKRDMLLVENQVPLRVLQILVNIQTGGDNYTTILNDLINGILKFFGLNTNFITTEERNTCLHILDVYRRALVFEQSTKASYEGPFTPTDYTIPSATELQEAGIRLKISETESLKDISFKDDTLYCPRIQIDHNTGSIFLNLMAFEALRIGTKKDVASYVYFMSSLMKTAADTRLLCELDIVHHKFRNDEDVVQLFSSKLDIVHDKDFPLDPERWIIQVYSEVNTALRNPIRKRLNAWIFDLRKNYLKSPWAVASVVAAIILFTLTGVQTAYTVLSYVHPKK